MKQECSKYGRIVHIHLDPKSQGYIYLKFDSVQAAQKGHQVLHGRFFAGKQLNVSFVPDAVYHSNFPKAAHA